jgi:RNAse (barnase) inhibitor barstar
MPNFILAKKLILDNSPDLLSVVIDGKINITLDLFYAEMAKQLKFPSYFAKNLDSFDELINDLSWLDYEAILLQIDNFDELLEEEDVETKELILSLLDQAADEQMNLKDRKALKIIVINTTYAADFLDETGIEFLLN